MQYINKVISQLKILNEVHKNEIYNYAIPSLWDSADVDAIYTYHNEKIVNPYTFYYENIKALCKNTNQTNYLQSLSKLSDQKEDGNWIKASSVYSTLIRTSAAYDHDRDGYITRSNLYELKETGTFLKFMVLLPYLKSIGIDTLYVLPFYQTSNYNRKGEFPSPYAIYDHYKLDESLADPMLDMSIEEQFSAFIEVCHMQNIRIIIDIVPRTCAIRSSLLKEHPEWFYWVNKEYAYSYKAFDFTKYVSQTLSQEELLEKFYTSKDGRNYLSQFKNDPKTQDPTKYKALLKKSEETHVDFLELIEQEYGMSVMHAFSDFLLDTQPLWNDITYFKLYLDNPVYAQNHLEADQAPYILQDVAKSSIYPGTIENRPLWDYLCDIIPYYQGTYGIDGVRIDMGHALPNKLVKEMIDKARKVDPAICVIAEEMDIRRSFECQEMGYNLLLGNGYHQERNIHNQELQGFYYNARNLSLPIFAMAESHDTLRIASEEEGRVLSTLLTFTNLFMPNGVPFLNSGQEFFETQPMNLGFEGNVKKRFMLAKDDFRYGKLALFDSYCFYYNNENFIEMLKEISLIRAKYRNEIIDLSKSVPAWFDSPNDMCLGSWFLKKDKLLLFVGNTDIKNTCSYNVHFINITDKITFIPTTCKDRFSSYQEFMKSEILPNYCIRVHLKPGEVKLITIK